MEYSNGKVREAIEMLRSYRVPIIREYLATYDILREICPKSSVTKNYQIQKAMETLAKYTGKTGIIIYVVRRGEHVACVPELGYLSKLPFVVYPVVELEYKKGLEKILAENLNKIWRIRVSADVLAVQLGLVPKLLTEQLSDIRRGVAQPAAQDEVGDSQIKYGDKKHEEEWVEHNAAKRDELIVKRDLDLMVRKLLEVNEVQDVVDFTYLIAENPRIVKAIVDVEPHVLIKLIELYSKLKKLGVSQALLDLAVDKSAIFAIIEKLYPKIYERIRRCL